VDVYPKSTAEEVGGLRYFARLLDKIRLFGRNELHSDYHANLATEKPPTA